MRSNDIFKILSLAGVILSLGGCADEKSDLEQARYLLGKGDTADAQTALGILQPMLTSTSGEDKFETVRLYVGAQLQAAGFDGIKVIANIVYQDSNDIVSVLEKAITFTADAQSRIADASATVQAFILSADFTNSTNVQKKQGIYFQFGQTRMDEALRVLFTVSGLSGTFDVNTCTANFQQSFAQFNNINVDLTDAHTQFNASGIDDTNKLNTLLTKEQAKLPTTNDQAKIAQFCQDLQSQHTHAQ